MSRSGVASWATTARRPALYALAVVVLAVVGGVLPIALALHFGALGAPRNDDWSAILSAFRLADGHGLTSDGWLAMNLVGQLVLSLPVVWVFGHRITALQVELVVFGVLGLIAVFDLARPMLSYRRALFVALMVAVGPMWASLSASYNTDVLAFAITMLCLAAGARAIRRDDMSIGLLCASLIFGFAAFSVREYGIIAPLAVLLAALHASSRWHRAQRRALMVCVVGFIGSALIFVAWRRGLPGFTSLSPGRPTFASVETAFHKTAESAVLVGLLVSPAAVLAGPIRLAKRAWQRAPRMSVVVGACAGLMLGGEMLLERASVPLGPGNYVLPNGTLGTVTVSGTRADLVAKPLRTPLVVIGIAVVVVLVLAALPPILDGLSRLRVMRLGTPESPRLAIVVIAASGYGVACALPSVFRLPYYDRYLLPLIPLLGVLVIYTGQQLATESRGAELIGSVTLVGLAMFGFVYAANSASFDGAKWRVATQAAKTAGGANRVEGGFEWTNYHAGREIFFGDQIKSPGDQIFSDQARSAGFCGVVRAQPHPSRIAGVPQAEIWGPLGAQGWIVAHRRHPC
jgi:hypothetical protein